MKIETLRKLDQHKYFKLVNFIYDLQWDKNLDRQVNLDYINVNDWESNIYPCVYVSNKYYPLRVKKYHRCSKFDLKEAIKFHFNKTPKTKDSIYGY
jgi:hypothetical protein